MKFLVKLADGRTLDVYAPTVAEALAHATGAERDRFTLASRLRDDLTDVPSPSVAVSAEKLKD